jgi:hypothetical protein
MLVIQQSEFKEATQLYDIGTNDCTLLNVYEILVHTINIAQGYQRRDWRLFSRILQIYRTGLTKLIGKKLAFYFVNPAIFLSPPGWMSFGWAINPNPQL